MKRQLRMRYLYKKTPVVTLNPCGEIIFNEYMLVYNGRYKEFPSMLAVVEEKGGFTYPCKTKQFDSERYKLIAKAFTLKGIKNQIIEEFPEELL